MTKIVFMLCWQEYEVDEQHIKPVEGRFPQVKVEILDTWLLEDIEKFQENKKTFSEWCDVAVNAIKKLTTTEAPRGYKKDWTPCKKPDYSPIVDKFKEVVNPWPEMFSEPKTINWIRWADFTAIWQTPTSWITWKEWNRLIHRKKRIHELPQNLRAKWRANMRKSNLKSKQKISKVEKFVNQTDIEYINDMKKRKVRPFNI